MDHKVEKQRTLERRDNYLNKVMSKNWFGGTEKNHKKTSVMMKIFRCTTLCHWVSGS